MNLENNPMVTSPKLTNFIEIRVYGLMRSGNHAITDWIQNQFKGLSICHLNNVRHGDVDPYSGYAERTLLNIDNVNEETDIETIRSASKHLLIYSYEDYFSERHPAYRASRDVDFVSSVFQSEFEAHRRDYLGLSKHVFDLLIIRDPFNCVASRFRHLQLRGSLEVDSKLQVMIRDWKILAKHALDLMHQSAPNRIVVSYNHWADDKAYRKQLSQTLMGTFDDSSMQQVANFGGGSSFQDDPAARKLTIGLIVKRWRKLLELQRYTDLRLYWKRLTSSPSDMKVTERWKSYVDEPTFRRIMADREVLDLSEQLFGELPGTREFVETLLRRNISRTFS